MPDEAKEADKAPTRHRPRISQARQAKEDAEVGAGIVRAIRNQHKWAAEAKARSDAEAKAAAEAQQLQDQEDAKLFAARDAEVRAIAEAKAEAR